MNDSNKIVNQICESTLKRTLLKHILISNANNNCQSSIDNHLHTTIKELFSKLEGGRKILSQLPVNEISPNSAIQTDLEALNSNYQGDSVTTVSAPIHESMHIQLTILQMKQYCCELESLLDLKDRGVIVIDAQKNIIYSNKYTENLCVKGLITRSQEILHFSSGGNRKLEACMLGSEIKGLVQDSFLIFDPDNNSYAVRVKKIELSSDLLESAKKWVVTILPLSEMVLVPEEEIKKFCSLFGITDAEEKAVSAIVKSIPLNEVALSCNKKGDTVRKQLKSAMNKAGVSSQKQLIQLIERFSFSAI